MGFRPGVDQPIIDYLGDLPFVPAAGTCMCVDPRGLANLTWQTTPARHYAFLTQAQGVTTSFVTMRVDLGSGNAVALPAAPAAAGGEYNTTYMSMIMDPTGAATLDTPTLYVAVALTAAPWIQFMSFDLTDLTAATSWTILTSPVPGAGGGGALVLGNLSLCHTCSTLGAFVEPTTVQTMDRYIYLNGDQGRWDAAGPSRLVRYDKVNNAWAVLTGGGGAARGGAPGAGSKMFWSPSYDWNTLNCWRGGNSGNLDRYNIATNTWTTVTTLPPILSDSGTDVANIGNLAPGLVAVRAGEATDLNGKRQIHLLDLNTLLVHSLADIDGPEGAAHDGECMIAWWIGGAYYTGIIPHSTPKLQRIRLVI